MSKYRIRYDKDNRGYYAEAHIWWFMWLPLNIGKRNTIEQAQEVIDAYKKSIADTDKVYYS